LFIGTTARGVVLLVRTARWFKTPLKESCLGTPPYLTHGADKQSSLLHRKPSLGTKFF